MAALGAIAYVNRFPRAGSGPRAKNAWTRQLLFGVSVFLFLDVGRKHEQQCRPLSRSLIIVNPGRREVLRWGGSRASSVQCSRKRTMGPSRGMRRRPPHFTTAKRNEPGLLMRHKLSLFFCRYRLLISISMRFLVIQLRSPQPELRRDAKSYSSAPSPPHF